jgi:hypothetical protein
MPDSMGIFIELAKSDSNLCECGIECETVQQFLLRCTRWNEQRRALIEIAEPHCVNLPRMLGGKAENVDGTSEPNGRA